MSAWVLQLALAVHPQLSVTLLSAIFSYNLAQTLALVIMQYFFSNLWSLFDLEWNGALLGHKSFHYLSKDLEVRIRCCVLGDSISNVPKSSTGHYRHAIASSLAQIIGNIQSLT